MTEFNWVQRWWRRLKSSESDRRRRALRRRGRPAVEMLEYRLTPAHMYLVTLYNDVGVGTGGQRDTNDPSGMSGDLRYCMNHANLDPGSTVDFGLPFSGPGTGNPDQPPPNPPPPPPTRTISLMAPLPTITVPMTIDGTSYPAFNGSPPIQLDGALAGAGMGPAAPAVDGLDIRAANVVVKGLVISNFSGDGIDLLQGVQDTISGCFIGTDLTGKAAMPNAGNGITIYTAHNTIGGSTARVGNVISKNGGDGIAIMPSGVYNTIWQDVIGTDVTGAVALANGGNGVHVLGGGYNQIGDPNVNPFTMPGTWHGNLISGNAKDGVRIESLVQGNDTYQPADNTVAENLIGTDATGLGAIPNQGNGVSIVDGADNVIGDAAALADPNVISGSGQDGVSISGKLVTGNIVMGNLIGVTGLGNAALGNNGAGVAITNKATDNTIGTAAMNVISGNSGSGVVISGANQNTVAANYIGTDAGGDGRYPEQRRRVDRRRCVEQHRRRRRGWCREHHLRQQR